MAVEQWHFALACFWMHVCDICTHVESKNDVLVSLLKISRNQESLSSEDAKGMETGVVQSCETTQGVASLLRLCGGYDSKVCL